MGPLTLTNPVSSSPCGIYNARSGKFDEVGLKATRLIIAVSWLLLAVGGSFAQTAQSGASLAANPVYQKNCKKCHGENAEGRHFGGPSLVSEKTGTMSADDLHGIIANGKGHMPKFADKLTPADVDTLVQQIEALNKK